MVDKIARRTAAAAVRKFIDGQLTNVSLEESFPGKTSDLAVHAIFARLSRHYGDDWHTFRLTDTSNSRAELDLLRRCVSFLETDLEYEWPPSPLLSRIKGWFGWGTDKRGDPLAWPYFRQPDVRRG